MITNDLLLQFLMILLFLHFSCRNIHSPLPPPPPKPAVLDTYQVPRPLGDLPPSKAVTRSHSSLSDRAPKAPPKPSASVDDEDDGDLYEEMRSFSTRRGMAPRVGGEGKGTLAANTEHSSPGGSHYTHTHRFQGRGVSVPYGSKYYCSTMEKGQDLYSNPQPLA